MEIQTQLESWQLFMAMVLGDTKVVLGLDLH